MAQALAALQRKAPNASLVAVYKKYCSSKYNEVRMVPVVKAAINSISRPRYQ